MLQVLPSSGSWIPPQSLFWWIAFDNSPELTCRGRLGPSCSPTQFSVWASARWRCQRFGDRRKRIGCGRLIYTIGVVRSNWWKTVKVGVRENTEISVSVANVVVPLTIRGKEKKSLRFEELFFRPFRASHLLLTQGLPPWAVFFRRVAALETHMRILTYPVW